MRLKIKKANVKRLASLSLLGAGGLGVTAPSLEANSIVFSGAVDAQIGDCPGCVAGASFAGPNGQEAFFSLRHATDLNQVRVWGVFLGARPGRYGTSFQVPASVSRAGAFSALPRGARWGNRHPRGGGLIAWLSTDTTYIVYGKLNTFNSVDRYLLFRFIGGDLSNDIYGWARLNVTFAKPQLGQPGYVDVELVDYAYDTSGAQIPAGETGTPEPSTFALTGLAALALGAKGLRAWRAARKRAVI